MTCGNCALTISNYLSKKGASQISANASTGDVSFVDKSAVDVELAVKHDMRRFLWVRGGEGVCRRRVVQEQEVADEVARRQGRSV